ncbi:hypothetical protein Deipe_4051 (plasmid) [Deinococcus peraridilitoris DSM 19664]|uniref:Uncharacterized protein n=1 Tax=Deinococcus peraridilitoris (strain DSM 19664 / LMG 22246 / CIP 109416 / KR-200) TaxID=937777 RepID=L0A6C7_DEIPD|nr:hypothetical protein Deipe_4051 [Deinococcus peraridilitoris DSM 19664]
MANRLGDRAAFQPLRDTPRLNSDDQRGNGESEDAAPDRHEQCVQTLDGE